MMASWVPWVGVMVVAAACRQDPRVLVQVAAVDSATVQLARAVADSLDEELMGLLAATLEQGGPALAIHICADSAQVRTLRHWKNGVYIRRVSRRVRNVDDTPDAIERRLLEDLAEARRQKRLPRELVQVIRAPDGTAELQYIRPLLVDGRCLPCHGDPAEFDPEVRAALARRYPEDRATGYAVGDLRGAVSVRVPLRSPSLP
jgi:hypothetical protein